MADLEDAGHQNEVALVSYLVLLNDSLHHGNENGELGSHLHHHGTQSVHGSALQLRNRIQCPHQGMNNTGSKFC